MPYSITKGGRLREKSETIHVVTAGSKWKNHKAVKLSSPGKAKVTLKKQKTLSIKAKAVGKAKALPDVLRLILL